MTIVDDDDYDNESILEVPGDATMKKRNQENYDANTTEKMRRNQMRMMRALQSSLLTLDMKFR